MLEWDTTNKDAEVANVLSEESRNYKNKLL